MALILIVLYSFHDITYIDTPTLSLQFRKNSEFFQSTTDLSEGDVLRTSRMLTICLDPGRFHGVLYLFEVVYCVVFTKRGHLFA